MLILKLSGGLGNQMFEYAYARRLQEYYGDELYFDSVSYTHLTLPTIA